MKQKKPAQIITKNKSFQDLINMNMTLFCGTGC